MLNYQRVGETTINHSFGNGNHAICKNDDLEDDFYGIVLLTFQEFSLWNGWTSSTVYTPCSGHGRHAFVNSEWSAPKSHLWKTNCFPWRKYTRKIGGSSLIWENLYQILLVVACSSPFIPINSVHVDHIMIHIFSSMMATHLPHQLQIFFNIPVASPPSRWQVGRTQARWISLGFFLDTFFFLWGCERESSNSWFSDVKWLEYYWMEI